jgi:DNA-binding transcriptional ArsR family regulator
VCHLTAILGQRQPYVSQQLAALREAGLVTGRRVGTLIFYRPADERVAVLLEHGKKLARALSGQELSFPEVREQALENCPCPRCQGES